MTALVQPYFIWKGGLERFDVEHVGQEFYQLIYLIGNGLIMDMVLYMQHAAAGRAYDVIEPGEILYEQVITTFRQVFETRVGHGLAATGLIRWIDDFTTELL